LGTDTKPSSQTLSTSDTDLSTVFDHRGVSTSESESIVKQLFTVEKASPPTLRSDILENPVSTKGSLKSQKLEDSPIGDHHVIESRGATFPPLRPSLEQYSPQPIQPNLRLKVVLASGLQKPYIFRYPDPFVLVTIDGKQTMTTAVVRNNLNPVWDEEFDMRVNKESILAIQILDQKDYSKKNLGFLGGFNSRVGDLIDVEKSGYKSVTLALEPPGSGKLLIDLSTSFRTPIPT